MNRAAIEAEMSRVEADFAELVGRASRSDLRRPQSRDSVDEPAVALPHGVRLPDRAHADAAGACAGSLGARSRRFAALLNAARRPFHVINYVGSWAGGQLVPPATMVMLMRRTLRALQRRLSRETEQSLALTMHFPTAWDPYFRQQMTVQDVYHYGTEHYDHHWRQLTLDQ